MGKKGWVGGVFVLLLTYGDAQNYISSHELKRIEVEHCISMLEWKIVGSTCSSITEEGTRMEIFVLPSILLCYHPVF